MPPVTQIPGYYWDEERRRYFKIETTAPSNAAWSSNMVKKRKLEDAASAEAAHQRELNKRRIVRSRVVNQPIMGGFFARECGGQARDVTAAAFADGVVEKGKHSLATSIGPEHMVVVSKNQPSNSCLAFTSIHVEAYDEDGIVPTHIFKDPSSGRIDVRPTDLPRGPYTQPILITEPICDIKYSEKIDRVITGSKYLPDNHGSHAYIYEPRSYPGGSVHLRSWMFSSGKPVCGRFLNLTTHTICPAPEASKYMFMAGTNRGLAHCSMKGTMRFPAPWGDVHTTREPTIPVPNSLHDVFAVDFQPGHPDVVLFGGRPGHLVFGDMRQKATKWKKLVFQDSITHIKTINEHQALVAGLRNTLSVFDLRYAEESMFAKVHQSKFVRRVVENSLVRQLNPLVVMSEYKNGPYTKIGLDLDKESGTVAAAHDDGTVALYSVRSGRRLPSRDIDKINASVPLQALQFQTFSGDHTASLFVGHRGNIEVYSFGVDDKDDEA